MALTPPPFSKDFSSPAEQAWKKGWSPYNETLGPYRGSDSDPKAFTNRFISSMEAKNPDYKGFYGQVFSADDAERSQQKIDNAYKSSVAQFDVEEDNNIANDFLNKYSESIARGLIEEDRAVTKDSLASLVREPAAARISDKDPNTANKYAGASGANIS